MNRQGIYKDRSYKPGYGRKSGTGSDFITEPGLEGNLFQRLFGAIKGYENGVFSVPGPKGAGDIVPAMLAPGEAVVPAKQTQKYAGLIKGIISDNIPGFVKSNKKEIPKVNNAVVTKGTSQAQLSMEKQKNEMLAAAKSVGTEVFEALTQRIKEAGGQLTQSIKNDPQFSLLNSMTSAKGGRSTGSQGMVKSHGSEKTPLSKEQAMQMASPAQQKNLKNASSISAFNNLTFLEPAGANQGKLSGQERGSFIKQNPEMFMNQMSQQSGIDASDPDFKRFAVNVANQLEQAGAEAVTDSQFAEMVERAMEEEIYDAAKGTKENVKQAFTEAKKTSAIGYTVTDKDGKARTNRINITEANKGKSVDGIETISKGTKGYRSISIPKGAHEVADEFQADITKARVQKTKTAGGKRRASKPQTTVAAQEAKQDAQAYTNEFNNTVEQAPTPFETIDDPDSDAQAAAAGASNGRKYRDKMDAEIAARRAQPTPGQTTQSGAPVPPGQRRRSGAPAGAPPPLPTSPGGVPQPGGYTSPIVDPMGTPEGKRETKKAAKGFLANFTSKFKNAGASIGKQVMSGVENSSLGRGIAAKLGAAAGNTVVDSNGNVMYDADTDTSYDKDGNAVGAGYAANQAAQNRAEAGKIDEDVLRDPETGDPVLDKKGRTISKKEAERQTRKNASRQKRGMVAGRLAGAMGSASMMLGMTSMMPGVGDNPMMQAIQGFMPALFGLSAVLPLLAALPAPLAALIAVVAAGVTAFVMFNNHMDKLASEARKTAEVMGVGTQAMEKLAEASGNVTATQAMDVTRSEAFQPFSIAAGKNPFGAQFVDSETGQELLGEVKKAGLENSGGSLFAQLSSAVASGALDVNQARQISYAIGEELSNQNIAMDVNAKLTKMFGPDGQNLLQDPLGIQLQIIEMTSEDLDKSFERLDESLSLSPLETEKAVESLKKDVKEGLDETYDKATEEGFLAPVAKFFSDTFPFLSRGLIDGFNQAGTEMLAPAAQSVRQYQVTIANAEAYTVKAQNALQNFQSSVDALDVNYDKQIEAAKAAGDQEKAQELLLEKEQKRNELMTQYGDAVNQVRKNFDNYANAQEGLSDTQKKLMDSVDGSIKRKFENDKDSQIIFKAAEESLKNMNLLAGDEYELKMLLAADAITLNTFDWISTNLDAGSVSRVLKLDAKLTGKDLNTFTLLLSRFGDDNQANFIAKFETIDNAQGATELLNTFSQINQLADTLGEENAQELMNFYVDPDNAEQLDRLKTSIDEIASYEGEKITVDYIQSIEGGEQFANVIKANQEYFDSLDKQQQITYTQIIQTMVLSDPIQLQEDAMAFAIARGLSPTGPYSQEMIDKAVVDYANYIAEIRTNFLEAMGTSSTGSGSGGSGNGPVASSLDQILNKLRDVRDETVQLKDTWVDSFAEINRVVGEGIDKFEGLSQQLRKLGANQPLIQYILGMSPEEYEERKDELLDFSGAKVVGLKEGAENLQVALNAIKLGEFQDAQQSSIQAIGAQNTAITRLVAAGYNLEEAYELVSDETLAYAIAAEENVDVMNRLVEVTKEAASANESFAFSQKLVTDASATATKDSVTDWISENIPDINKAMFDAVLSDEYISGLLDTLQGGGLITQEQFKQIEDFFNNLTASGEVDLKVGDIDFAQAPIDEFSQGMSNVQNKFKIMETTIQLKYEGLNRADENIIQSAENDIALLNYELDDLNAELDDISEKEQEVNEKYDKRFEALDKVKEVNSDIAAQQKEQLTIADALSLTLYKLH